jgi:hypothetical protein
MVAWGAPLTVLSSNNRYLDDGGGKGLYITGSHIWNNFVDWGTSSPPSSLNHGNFVDWIDGYDHNFIRGWCWEIAEGYWPDWTEDHWYFSPDVFTRSGNCCGGDGKNKFDLTGTNNTYLNRIRNRSIAYRDNSPTIFNSVMMFIGAGTDSDSWPYYPFKSNNNTNGIDGDKDNDGDGEEIHSLPSQPPYIAQAVIDRQEEYIADVIDKVNDLDNIIWEIGNELPVGSSSWQYHMIDYIQSYEAAYKSKQHLVWMNNYHAVNSDLFVSNAELVSPNRFNGDGHYRNNPIKNTTGKVVVLDTDHLWGIGGDWAWVWRGFTRGYHMIFMDPYWGNPWKPDLTAYEYIRTAMGVTRKYAERLDFSVVIPYNGRASSNNCLTDSSDQYLAYQRTDGADLTIQPLASGEFYYEWIDPIDGDLLETGNKTGNGTNKVFNNPSSGQAALYIVNIDDGVSVDLERFDDVRGLIAKNVGDGETEPAAIGGRDCRKNLAPASDHYLYLCIEDDWAYQGSLTEAWITLEYYDVGTGYLRLDYDGSSASYTNGGNENLGDTETWKTKTWHITDAYFGNRQNASADFRIYKSNNEVFYLDTVAVSDTDPNPGPPGQATNPSPADLATGVSITADLSWTAGSGATSHDVYFGTDSTPDAGEFQGNQSGTTYDPGTLSLNTTYYWRIDEVNGSGTTTGTVWSFTTQEVTVPTVNVLTAGTITIDGSTSDWNLSEFTTNARGGETEKGDIAVTGYVSGTLYYASKASESVEPTSASDHTAKVYGRHDSTYQYFLVRCDDDDIQTDEGTQGDNWKNDCVEFYIDPSHNHGSTAMSNSTSDIQLVIDAANRQNVYMCTSSYATQVLNGVTSAVSTDASGWYLEVRIDKSALDPDIPDTGTFGVDFNYRDNDDSNNMSLTTIYSWSDDSGSGFPSKIPDNWGDADLAELSNPPGQATTPPPANSATGVSINADMSWTAGSGATSHDVYFGTDSTPDSGEFQGNQAGTTYDPGTLSANTTYYWRIDEVNSYGTTTGVVWSFTTLDVPGQATNPSPANSATDVSTSADLSWTAGSGATSHDVYFGTTSPGTFQGNQAGTTYDPGTMLSGTTYYWRIDEVNEAGTTTGTVWSFTTSSVIPNDADFVSSTIPDKMLPGDVVSVDVTMKNVGTNTWYRDDNLGYKLGAVDDSDPFAAGRHMLDVGETIETDEQKTFTFNMTAPTTAGTYTTDWRMVEELVEWFGEEHEKIVTVLEAVWVDMGTTDDENGLGRYTPEPGNANTEGTTIGGRNCRKVVNTGDRHMFFLVDDDWAYQGSRSDVYLSFDYYDTGTDGIRCVYDGTSGNVNAGVVDFTDTDTWKTKTWHLTDAYFGNRSGAGYDFRLTNKTSGYIFYVDVVSVSEDEP